MGRLFIAEKPSVAAAIADRLGPTGRGAGYTVCGEDVVSSCFGHLFEMPPPEFYDGAYKSWHFDHLPIVPAQWPALPKDKTLDRVRLLGRLLKDADSVVHAGDPDNEGQLLVDQVIEHFDYRGPVWRYWASAADPASVEVALGDLRDNRDYAGMRDAALARGRADWLIGMNVSRAFTLRAQEHGNRGVVPVGRVLTPMLEMVDERCRKVANFRPIPYHVVTAQIQHAQGDFTVRWQAREDQPGHDEEGRLIDTAVADALVDRLAGVEGTVMEHSSTPTVVHQPRGLSLAGIGLLASETFGYGAAHTLELCQALYDVHKLTTYPRGDCEYLPESMHAAAPAVLAAVRDNVPAISGWLDGADPSIQSRTWDNRKITAHHGIIPTPVRMDLSRLSEAEQNIYQLIVRHYLAQFYPVHEYEDIKVSVSAVGENFRARGKVITAAGWKQLFQEAPAEDDDRQDLPQLQQGDAVTVISGRRHDKKTTPPKLFTEGTLPIAMAHIHSHVEDPADKAALKEGDGIGTPATRGPLIEESKRRGFLETRGKAIVSTAACQTILAAVPPRVKSPVLTAQFQRQLKEIEQGGRSLQQFVEDQVVFVSDLIAQARSGLTVAPRMACPGCGKGLFRRVARRDNSGHFWSCSEWRTGCTFTADDKDGQANVN